MGTVIPAGLFLQPQEYFTWKFGWEKPGRSLGGTRIVHGKRIGPTTPLSMDGHTWTKLKLMGFFDSMIWQDQLEVSFQTNFRNDNWKTQTLQI